MDQSGNRDDVSGQSAHLGGKLKLNKQIIKILYFRYLNICTVHKKRETNKKKFIIAKVLRKEPRISDCLPNVCAHLGCKLC